MTHLPDLPRTSDFAPVVAFAFAILLAAIALIAGGITLLWDASVSTLALFLFPVWMLSVESIHALVHLHLRRRERLAGTSDLLYYVALVPEVAMQFCKLVHHVHVWYVPPAPHMRLMRRTISRHPPHRTVLAVARTQAASAAGLSELRVRGVLGTSTVSTSP